MKLLLVLAMAGVMLLGVGCDQIRNGVQDNGGDSAKFAVGDAVVLHSEAGVCLQTYTSPGFDQAQFDCRPDGEVRMIADGPIEVQDPLTGESHTWWGLDGAGGWIPQDWLHQ